MMKKRDENKLIHKKEVKEYTLSNPLLHQVLTYIVVLFLFSIAILSSLWMVMLVKAEGLVAIGGIPVITFFAGYSAYVGIQLLRYKSNQVSYNENGFTVFKKGKAFHYAWQDVTKTKYHGTIQVLKLFNAKGKNIYTVHGITRANKKFINKAGEIVGFTTDVF